MAFATTRGENGVDFIGTDGVDALFALNETGTKFIDAKGGNDTVDLFDESGVVGTAEVKLGEGADIFTMGANSTITNRLTSSTVNGGPGNDDITTEGTLSTKLRGNEGDDDFFLLSNYTDTTINGNSGQDSFTLTEAAAAGTANTIVLSNAKILGGSGNDGQMDFSDAGLALGTANLRAVDSVIQGGKGLDTITIGDVVAGTTNFRVSGGADNDTINVANTIGAADGVAYNGAAGEDSINFADTNAADAVTKGGDGNDRITIGSGTGAIAALGEAGDDVFILNTVQAATNPSTGGKHTITGAAGGDTYNIEAATALNDREALNFVVSSVSDSAAAITGTAVTFDTFTTSAIDNTAAAAVGAGTVASLGLGDVIDMRGGSGEALVGNRLNAAAGTASIGGVVRAYAGEVINYGLALPSTATTFAALKTAIDGTLSPSISNVVDTVTGSTNRGIISLQMIKVDAGGDDAATGIDGYYAVLNNTNTILDSGDMMFQMATTFAGGGVGDANAAAELAQIELAMEAGFDLA